MEFRRATASRRAVEPVEHEDRSSAPVPIASGRFRPMQNVAAPAIEVTVGNPARRRCTSKARPRSGRPSPSRS